ncbi:MAG: ABC transporter substrate-binding protein [Faecousia sp.]
MKKTIALILALVMVLGLLAGCASEKEPAQTGSAQTPTTGADTQKKETQSSGGTIKIGISCPITGDSAEYGQQFAVAAQITADEINANGGINGKKLEFVTMDSKNDAKESCDIARVFVDNPEIVAVIGDFTSTCSMAAAPIYQEAGLTMISPSASHVDYAPIGDYIFGTMSMQADESKFQAKSEKNYQGYNSTAILYINSDWGVLAEDAFNEGAKNVGLEVTACESYVSGETDFKTVLTKIRQTNPEVLTILGQYAEASSIVNQCAELGWDVPVDVAGSSLSQQFIDLCGENANGIYSQAPFFYEESDPAQAAFGAKFVDKLGYDPTIFGCIMHDTVEFMALAIGTASDDTDRTAVRDAIRDYNGYSGLMGPIVFNEDGAVIRDFRVAIIEDNAWVPVTEYGELD